MVEILPEAECNFNCLASSLKPTSFGVYENLFGPSGSCLKGPRKDARYELATEVGD